MSDILDYHLQHVLHKMISDLPFHQRAQLKNILGCGQKIMYPGQGGIPAVYLITNGEQSKFFGQAHCQNPFCCPVCSARVMEKNRARIASAIDMLKSEYFGFMVTFTIPHLRFMKCRETTDILYKTWSYFHQKNFKKTGWHVYQRFNADVPIAHWVRVCEYTYGEENGWHPHFHCVFWTKRENADKILNWQKELNEFWTAQAKRVTLKYWKENNLHSGENLETLCDRLFSKVNDVYPAFKISVNKETGKVAESLSSDYLTGWGVDREVTGNIRKEASHEGHYTPYQILSKAEFDHEFRNIYIDFCLSVTRKPVHHRLNFSKTGIVKMIEEYQRVNGYTSAIIQKKISWEVVACFDEKQWSKLLSLNESSPVLSNILYLATYRRDLLEEYFEWLDVRRCCAEEYEEALQEQCRIVEDLFNGARNTSASTNTSLTA